MKYDYRSASALLAWFLFGVGLLSGLVGNHTDAVWFQVSACWWLLVSRTPEAK